MRNNTELKEPFAFSSSSSGSKNAELSLMHEIIERESIARHSHDVTPHLSLSQILLNQGRAAEAREHAKAAWLFLHDRFHTSAMLERTGKEDRTASIASEDPGLIDDPENMALHGERSLRLIHEGRLPAATEHGRNLVTFLPGEEARRIYLNAVHMRTEALQGDEKKFMDFLNHEMKISKALNVSPPEQTVDLFLKEMSKANGRTMRGIAKNTDLSAQPRPQEQPPEP